MLPLTFKEWKYCIEQDCKINLTKDFAKQRLAVYTDTANLETQKFLQQYGEAHLQNIVHWFSEVINN